MNYSNPMDVAGRFKALPISYSSTMTKQDDIDDFTELMRAASVRTLMEKLDDELKKVCEVVSVAKESVKSLSTNEVVFVPDDDYIEELGELDDIGLLEAINKNRLEYIPLNKNVGETEEDIRFNERVRDILGR
ncbi:hypothetical protein K1719_009740 [Acacia pycnantha]|nr:hypothetical protein K1719_009740 [Acacia pycnantha]